MTIWPDVTGSPTVVGTCHAVPETTEVMATWPVAVWITATVSPSCTGSPLRIVISSMRPPSGEVTESSPDGASTRPLPDTVWAAGVSAAQVMKAMTIRAAPTSRSQFRRETRGS